MAANRLQDVLKAVANSRTATPAADMNAVLSTASWPTVGFFGTVPLTSRPAVTGSRGGNAALASLLTTLANLGLITDSTTP